MPYTFKKSKLALNTAAAFVLMSSLGAQVTFAAHTYDEATKTDTYTNQLISESRGGDPNDIKGYNHADRKLVLIWDGNPDRKDGAAIRGATVVADEITINTDFVKANAFSGKSIISSGNDVTHITANKISVQSGDDAIYTESNGTVTIDGFSELKVSSQSDIRWGGHGIVDNGTGITLIGKDDSTIEVNSRQNAMGNGYVSGPIGKGITASAGKIILTSTGNALGATAVGKSPFVIDVNAKEVSLSGENHAAYAQYKGTIKINQKVKEGSLKAEGSFVASRDGCIEANLGGTGSYIKHGSDGLAVSAGQVSYAEDSAGKVTLNSTGSEHYIDGLLEAINEGSTLTINSTGENFKLSNTTPDATYLSKASRKGKIDYTFSGANATITGNILSQTGGETGITLRGDNANLTGDLLTKWVDRTSSSNSFEKRTEEDNAKITLRGWGNNATLTGNLTAETSKSTIEVLFVGNNATMKGSVSSIGSSRGTKQYAGNTVSIGLMGINSLHEDGNLLVQGDNTLNALYMSKGTKATVNADVQGTMRIGLENSATWEGEAVVGTFRDASGKDWEGKLYTSLLNQATWKGDLRLNAGTATVELEQKSTWEGNLTSDSEKASSTVTLDDSTLKGNILLKNGVASATLTKSEWTGDLSTAGETSNADVKLTDSKWEGNLSSSHEKAVSTVALTNSTLTGNVEMTAGTTTSTLTTSEWKGNLKAEGENSKATATLTDSQWEGDVTSNDKAVSTLTLDNSALTGNADVASGMLTAKLTKSEWKGNLKAEGEGANASATLTDSKLEGDISSNDKAVSTLTLDNSALTGNADVASGTLTATLTKSEWKGNLKAEGEGANASATLTDSKLEGNISSNDKAGSTLTLDNSALTGNADVASGTLTATLTKSEWKGNLKAEGEGANASTTLTGSKLEGDVTSSGKAVSTLTLENSSLTGNIGVSSATATATLTKSEWTGDLSAEGETTTSNATLTDSTWTGNLSSSSDNVTAKLSKTDWTGNLESTSAKTAAVVENGTWKGLSTEKGAVTLKGNTLWEVTGDSALTSLTTEAETFVTLEGEARTLTTDTLNGSGTIALDLAYLGDDVSTYRDAAGSDFITVKSAGSGTYTILGTEASNFTLTAKQKLFFATTPAGSAAFKLTPQKQTYVVNRDRIYNSLNSYAIHKETDQTAAYSGFDDWFLTLDEKVVGPNENAVVPGDAFSAVFALWRDDDTLLKRLGELHYNQEKDGLWARVTNRKLSRSGDHALSAKLSSFQLGYDHKKVTEKQGDWYFGLAYTHSWGNPKYDLGYGKIKANELTLYATNLRENGHTFDIVGRVGRIDSKFTTILGEKGEFENVAASFGVEYGKKTFVSERFAIEPQAQLTYHYLWGDDYHTQSGIEAHQDNADSLVGRLGVLASYEWGSDEKTGRIYAKASVLHDFLGDMSSSLYQDITYRDSDDLGDTWYVVGLGTNLKLGKNWHLYFDAETSLNAEVKTKYNLNAGVRVAF